MDSFYTILTISYLLGMGFVIIGKIRLKKIDKEFSKSNCDISEMERIKRLPYMISEVERKRRLPYVICIIIGYSIPVIVSIILILGLFDII
ncbi:hypothetical protein [Clostridium tunisiense]|uniref:hypothetical protein n=1 Tax=Clostridium tunisiense TaxID=219748 RepID=UPI00037FF30B|nr:hypothetical protein [Clostridium tunisiense]